MEVFEAIRTVLAVRAYRDEPVPAALVRRIVDAGRLSASAQNLQPWHFIVIEERETLRKIGAMMRTAPYVVDAAFAIVVVVEPGAIKVTDGSRAIQNMILTAWSEGVGSNWTGFGRMPQVEELLGVPETHQGLAVVPFGYPATKIGAGRKKRKRLAEVASRERYAVPFA